MFTRISQQEAFGAFSVLAAVSDDTNSPAVAIACLAVALGHPDLLDHAKSHRLVLPRLAKKVTRLCDAELERAERGTAINMQRFCTLRDLLPEAETIKIAKGVKLDPKALAERYRLLIPGQSPK